MKALLTLILILSIPSVGLAHGGTIIVGGFNDTFMQVKLKSFADGSVDLVAVQKLRQWLVHTNEQTKMSVIQSVTEGERAYCMTFAQLPSSEAMNELQEIVQSGLGVSLELVSSCPQVTSN